MTGSSFEELEKRCKALKLKKYIFFILLFMLFSVIAVYAIYKYRFLNTLTMKSIKVDKNITKTSKLVHKERKIKHKIMANSETKKKKIANVLKLQPKIIIPKVLYPKKQNEKIKAKTQKDIKSLKTPVLDNTSFVPKRKKFKISITTTNTLTILLKNYNINPTYINALKLAQEYLNQKKYKKALFWAKKANSIDSTKAKSWIVYAKAKYALGDKKDAIESLKTFLNYFYSKDAFDLLKKYSGEIK